jgi:hypothetical protein
MLPRWLTSFVAEYDLINEYWVTRTLKGVQDLRGVEQKPQEFFAFSSTVYFADTDMIVLGGLDDKVPNLPNFSNRAILVNQV